MASELLKNRALIQQLKEPDIPVVKFNLGDTGFEELITLPEKATRTFRYSRKK